MKTPTGFKTPEGRKAFYIDQKGKDISFNRWRVNLYYHKKYAELVFFDSEEEYNTFINKNLPACYHDYTEYAQTNRGRI